MYEEFYSFKHKPFDLTPNPDYLFTSSTHKKAITYLDYGIKEKIGFILLTGEIGAGKTTIIRNLIQHLSGPVTLSRIYNTKVSSEQLISMINEDFGLEVENKNKTKLLSELNDFLIEQYSRKIQPILIIDEAQNLSPDLLEEIRLLSNLETDKSKLLQILLVGQPELIKILMLPELSQLRQRINIKYHITPLSLKESEQYIKHRLTIAGNPDAIQFEDEKMLISIYEFSRGIPRLINILCDFALLAAFVEGEKTLTVSTVREVIKDLDARGYWNEESQNTTGTADTARSVDLLKSMENMAFRLIQLEEKMNSCVHDISSLSQRIISFEEQAEQQETKDERHLSGILERLEEKLVSRVLLRVMEDNKLPELLERLDKLEHE